MKTILIMILWTASNLAAQTSLDTPIPIVPQKTPLPMSQPYQTQLPDRSVAQFSIDAHTIASGYKTTSEWETYWGSYIRDYKGKEGVLCRVQSVSHTPQICTIVYAFFAGKSVVSSGAIPVYIRASGFIEFPFYSSGTYHIEHYEALGETYSEGARPTSWIIQIYVGGKLSAYKASSSDGDLVKFAETAQNNVITKGRPIGAPNNSASSNDPLDTNQKGMQGTSLDKRPQSAVDQ